MRIKLFSESLFRLCPAIQGLIQNIDLGSAISHFQSYKSVIPVRGAIILNKNMDMVLLVKGWKKNATWGFPRGKINKDEPDEVCAVREVQEEIGIDISPYLNSKEFIDVTFQQKNFKLYIVHGVPESTKFSPQTRKEISEIEWHDVNTLPAFSSKKKIPAATVGQFFLVAPFMSRLAKYISKKKGLSSESSEPEVDVLKELLGVSQKSNGNKDTGNTQTQANVLSQALYNDAKENNTSTSTVLHPGALDQQIPTGPGTQADNSILSHFPQPGSSLINLPYHSSPYFTMPPAPGSFVSTQSSQSSQQPSAQYYTLHPDKLPEPPQPQAQPNKALLALLAQSKAKQQVSLPSTTALSTDNMSISSASSSSQALLSLLQKPKPTSPAPLPISDASKSLPDKPRSQSSMLLDMLKPKSSSTSALTSNSVSIKEESKNLHSMNGYNNTSLPQFDSNNQNTPQSDGSILLGILHSKPNTPTEHISSQNPTPQSNQVNIKDTIFGSKSSSLPSSFENNSESLSQKTNMLTVSDIESKHSSANSVNSPAHTERSSSSNSGKELLDLLHRSQNVQPAKPVQHETLANYIDNLQNTQSPNTSISSPPDLLNAIFASAEKSGSVNKGSPIVDKNSSSGAPKHANDSANVQSLLSLIRGGSKPDYSKPANTNDKQESETASSLDTKASIVFAAERDKIHTSLPLSLPLTSLPTSGGVDSSTGLDKTPRQDDANKPGFDATFQQGKLSLEDPNKHLEDFLKQYSSGTL